MRVTQKFPEKFHHQAGKFCWLTSQLPRAAAAAAAAAIVLSRGIQPILGERGRNGRQSHSGVTIGMWRRLTDEVSSADYVKH